MKLRASSEEVVGLLVTTGYVVAVSWYCYLVALGKVSTVLATWLLFLLTVTAGYISYLRSPGKRRTWTQNVCNMADLLAIAGILLFVVAFGAYREVGFRAFDGYIFLVWVGILLTWLLTKNARVANIAFNLLLVIAYVPLVQHLASSSTHSEPYFTWAVIFIASIAGLYAPLKNRDDLGAVYASRSVLSTGVVLLLMLRIDFAL